MYSPADTNTVLKQCDDDEVVYDKPYREAIGSVMYTMVCTRPDIANAVGNVSKYCERYSNDHWIAVKRIIRYLNTTLAKALTFDGSVKNGLKAYADASWGSDEDTRRSTTGYVVMLNETAVSWKSQRQVTVAASSTEAEYMALFSVIQEVLWIRRLLKDLSYGSNEPTTVYQDNKSTIMMVKNPGFHGRTKHIGIKYHFSREQVQNNSVTIVYKCTQEMIALTKNVSKHKIRQFCEDLGLQDDDEMIDQGKVLEYDQYIVKSST
jgi:hypothetical protein